MGLLTKFFKTRNNPALNFILANYAGRIQTEHLVNVLPSLARVLYAEATQNAGKMHIRALGRHRWLLLTECILDLELAGGFDEVVNYTGDLGLASCYIDAVLFQATGKGPSPEPTESQYRDEGTQTCRGPTKYSKAKEYFKMSDPAGWLFGKEYAAILSGSAQDIAIISAVLPHTVTLRIKGKEHMRYALRGP